MEEKKETTVEVPVVSLSTSLGMEALWSFFSEKSSISWCASNKWLNDFEVYARTGP